MVLFLTLEVVPKLTLERLKSGTETNSPAYIYRRRPRFLPTFLAFCKEKQHVLAILRPKRGKGKTQKGRPKLVVLFLVEKCTFSPVLS